MKHPFKTLAPALGLCAATFSAQAADAPDCQILIMEALEVKDAAGEAQMASFFPATDFITSVQDEISGHISEVNSQKIQALMCTRNDIIPTESDYGFLATGIPFVLSQDFDSPDTDSLTIKWIDDKFKYAYKGFPLSDEAQATLKDRLAEFSDQGLNAWALAAAEANSDPQVEAVPESEPEADTENLVIISYDESKQTDVINTTSAREKYNIGADEVDAIEAEEINKGDIDATEATQLNIEAKIETQE